MTINTPKQAAEVAKNTHTNIEGRCQEVTRGYYNAPSVGDVDGDGAADAEDGGKSEPFSARHFDRTGRYGYPATFFGGRLDNGHRAIFLGPGIVRSTDFDGVTKRYHPGVVGNGTVEEVERAMTASGFTPVKFAFWSTTIDGLVIPPDKKPRPLTKGWRVEKAEQLIKHSHKGKPDSRRAKLLNRIADLLAKVPKH